MTNVISFKTQVDKKDLEAFTQALVETTTKLQIENEQLKEKVKHLEELLMNVPIKPIGGLSVIDYEVRYNSQNLCNDSYDDYDKEAFDAKYEK